MFVCIPVMEDKGLESPVSAHFGSTPSFMIVDTDSKACRAIPNRDLGHAHGMCQPLKALAGERIDGFVVGGIGMGALNKLQQSRIQVFLSQHSTVGATVDALRAGTLRVVTPELACHEHGGHGAAHSGDQLV
jgi:predicted Fe-Mo cluster-binding NifX family protein